MTSEQTILNFRSIQEGYFTKRLTSHDSRRILIAMAQTNLLHLIATFTQDFHK